MSKACLAYMYYKLPGQQRSASPIVAAFVVRQPILIRLLGNFVLMPHAANMFTVYDLNI